MKRFAQFKPLAIAVYAVAAVVTFGAAYRDQPADAYADTRLSGALLTSIAWPLYVSAKLWSLDRP
ncbi:hypothetical protein J2045_003392 [Peteryoungia aggregata LMG 23059]|uniref:Uncharacterized protein n=1 Tax=Peteryoungia aggregata LMG 23059 TaxID=1368425 RepID=A0ABU0GAG1_9HYPH|nr:hypothetical protein [Peteryoungia aggregata]MDQ0422344.1 hypothetical protein [Peteryoungia aggregata LMG 23059]